MPNNVTITKVFKAVADPTRREIFHVLMIASAAMSLTQIAQQFEITRQGVTKHIKLLEEAGLITTSGQGRERFCEANPTPLNEIKNWVSVYDRFWENKLNALDTYVTKEG